MKKIKNVLLAFLLIPCALVCVACGGPAILFQSDLNNGNNELFKIYGSVEDNIEDKTITLNKSSDNNVGPSTYFGEADKNFAWVDGGYTVSIKFKIDSTTMNVGQGFNWTISLNNKSETPAFITERSMYFRKYNNGVKVGYTYNGSSDELNSIATSNTSAVLVPNGWVTMKFKFYEGASEQIKLNMTLLKNDGTEIFTQNDARLADNTDTVVTTNNVGGLRYAWLSWMSAPTLEVKEVLITKNM